MSRHRTGTTSTRRGSRFVRRSGVILPAAGIATFAVAAVSVAAWVMGPSVSGASGAAEAIESIPHSKTVVLLEQERKQMIVMSTASRTLTVVVKPSWRRPPQLRQCVSRKNAASGPASAGNATGSTTGVSVPPVAPPIPVRPSRSPMACWPVSVFRRHNSGAFRTCGSGKAAGPMTRRIPAVLTAFRSPCPDPKWPPQGRTGRPTRGRRSYGASAT